MQLNPFIVVVYMICLEHTCVRSYIHFIMGVRDKNQCPEKEVVIYIYPENYEAMHIQHRRILATFISPLEISDFYPSEYS